MPRTNSDWLTIISTRKGRLSRPWQILMSEKEGSQLRNFTREPGSRFVVGLANVVKNLTVSTIDTLSHLLLEDIYCTESFSTLRRADTEVLLQIRFELDGLLDLS